MPQSTDVIINGAGYMIEPGTTTSPGYRRLQDGFPEGRTERTTLTDFFGGQHRALQLERDRVGDSLRIGPTLNGQGVRPWPFTRVSIPAAMASLDKPSCNAPIPSVVVRDYLYVAIGKSLYRASRTGTDGAANTFALVNTFANTITDLCIYSSYGMLLCFGSAADIQFWNTLTSTAATLFTGERGYVITAYAGHALWSDARTTSRPTVIRMVTGTAIDFRPIDYDPIAMTTVGAEAAIVTKQALYTFNGRVKDVMVNNPAYTVGGTQPAQVPGREWSGEFAPFFQQGVYTERDDFRLFVGFGGRTIAWIANGVHELVPSGDRAGWRSTGLTGRRCFGGCVAAGYVIACIESDDGQNEIWAYNGSGWWRIATQPMPSGTTVGTWCNPMSTGSGGTGPGNNAYQNLWVFTDGMADIVTMRLVEVIHTDGTYMTNYPTAQAELVTPLIDASERDKPKAWRKVGAIFSAPTIQGNPASTDPVTIYLDWSTNAGASWTVADSLTLTANTLANYNVQLGASLSGIVSSTIVLRVRWASVLDWAPVLTGVWTEHEVLNNPARRRKWNLRIHARDQEIDRDGVVLSRTGRQLIADLWQAWEQDTTLTFRDIDYDDAPVQRTVRIVGIAEAVVQPADASLWGDATITLNLVEV